MATYRVTFVTDGKLPFPFGRETTGYAVDDEEHTEGISALGTGFIDPLGRAVALSVPIPTTRFKRLRSGLVAKLLAARERILRALNSPGPV